MKDQHVLCIFPYRTSELSGFLPPIGLEHIAAAIEDLVESITIINMQFKDDASSFIKDTTSLICVSINWEDEKEEVCELINQLPSNILTVIGGRYATINAEEFFAACPNIDIIIRGDGEEIIRDIILGEPLEEITGISFRRDGKVIHNPNRLLDVVSNTIYPNRRLRRYTYRFKIADIELGYRIDLVSSSRGCPYSCKFCTFNMNPLGGKRNWSGRSAESVVKEIEEIEAELVLFTDDNFIVDMDRAGAIFDLIKKRGIKKKFALQCRIELASRPDVLQKMQDVGVTVIMVGIESPHDWILKQLDKRITQQGIRDAFKVFNRFDRIVFQGFFIIGNIGETEEEMKYISAFAREIGLNIIVISFLRYERFSHLKEIIDATNGYHIGQKGIIYSDRYPITKLYEIKKWIKNDFYSIHNRVKLAGKIIRIGGINQQVVFPFIRGCFDRLIYSVKSNFAW
ncbi:MAG: hypothetical protein A3G31_05630 [Candidatus Schekmanbacteria bacterium RIFCSPLOWO2_12_FULL_38_15]|uniref:Radical SAM core domain-containing protein n=1 Tax=Candidatus Schekmanbacteria bacterium RIFCSPLOWO2_12_FULL_38_15 TaxID=1817883 RepID=A0A1F7SLS2_9BACT|nr:MAG: hypothetical protein A3G31_05630 [Candidatus Schekmanbacteria bacterium RIFCSPLOWO2_12_FULL_38_15]